MSVNLPLKDMTLQEKLAAIELLWDDVARSPESVESPGWHKDVIDARRDRVAEGKAHLWIGRPPKRISAAKFREN